MDRKSIILIVICALLIFAGRPLVDHFFPPPPAPTNVVSQATNPLPESTNQLTAPSNQSAPVISGAEPSAAAFVVQTNVPEHLLSVSNENARYTFTSRGGGLEEVELIRYPESVSTLRRKRSQTNDFATLNTPVAPPYLAILGTRGETLQGDGIFTLTPTNHGVRAEKTLTNGLTLVKDFQIGTDYLVTASVRLENRSGQPLNLPAQHWVVGTATPLSPQDNGLMMNVMWSDGEKPLTVPLSYFSTNTTKMFIFSRTPTTEFSGGSNDVHWVSAQNQFFTMVTMLTNPSPDFLVRMINLPPPSQEEIDANPRTIRMPQGMVTSLNYPAQTLGPGQTLSRTLNLYAGPKEYRTLARISEEFNNHIDWVMGFTGSNPFTKLIGILARWLLEALGLLHDSFRIPYGLAIITITVLIKLVFWPITQYSTKSMKRMQALGPQMKAVQEKYKDDPQKQQQKIWEFYRKNKINPLSGCLPMLLQLPLLYGFYTMLRSAIELRGASFLWIGDLSKSDTIFVIPGFNIPVNPMPLLMGATMLWQSHLTPPSPGMDPAQQKMMRYMPLIFLVFMYNVSSGLVLYWTVQNLLSILQTKMIQRSDGTLTPPAAGAKPAVAVAPQKKRK
jgi:YidC/Oxa1 family membrane protein insertase